MSVSVWLPGSSVCGILQARILKWVAISILQGISTPQGLNLQGDSFTCWVIKEAYTPNFKKKRKIFIKRNRKQSSLRLLCDTQSPGDKGTTSTFMSQVVSQLFYMYPSFFLHLRGNRISENVWVWKYHCDSFFSFFFFLRYFNLPRHEMKTPKWGNLGITVNNFYKLS